MTLEEIKLRRLAGQYLLAPPIPRLSRKTFVAYRRSFSAMRFMVCPSGATKSTPTV